MRASLSITSFMMSSSLLLLSLSLSSFLRPVRGFVPAGRHVFRQSVLLHTTTTTTTAAAAAAASSSSSGSGSVLNLHTVKRDELERLVVAWGFPKYRAEQIWVWIRHHGVTDVEDMTNVPKALRARLVAPPTLKLETELVSKDGTKKRLYRLHDGQLIESVLMPYEDGRYTACVSSQAGCAMGCVFCATGQMGFGRQLTASEILEQVSRFSSDLKRQNNKRLSNVVFMGMGEPLANYKNVMEAVNRITSDLGIGARRITISTVGLVPMMKKLMNHGVPPVRLAVSLHAATNKERSKIMPVNRRYGGLEELMGTIREYTERTRRRVTLEWALMEGQNDSPETARTLGKLLKDVRRDMVHVNVIPLNPTDGYQQATPSSKERVRTFVRVLQDGFGIACTPRMRRGIDIDAGCGQLKSKLLKQEQNPFVVTTPNVGVYQEEEEVIYVDDDDEEVIYVDDEDEEDVMYEDEEDVMYEDEVLKDEEEEEESDVLVFPENPPKELNKEKIDEIVEAMRRRSWERHVRWRKEHAQDEKKAEAKRLAKRRRKKLLKHIKSVRILRELSEAGRIVLTSEHQAKIDMEPEWRAEVAKIEQDHNLLLKP